MIFKNLFASCFIKCKLFEAMISDISSGNNFIYTRLGDGLAPEVEN